MLSRVALLLWSLLCVAVTTQATTLAPTSSPTSEPTVAPTSAPTSEPETDPTPSPQPPPAPATPAPPTPAPPPPAPPTTAPTSAPTTEPEPAPEPTPEPTDLDNHTDNHTDDDKDHHDNHTDDDKDHHDNHTDDDKDHDNHTDDDKDDEFFCPHYECIENMVDGEIRRTCVKDDMECEEICHSLEEYDYVDTDGDYHMLFCEGKTSMRCGYAPSAMECADVTVCEHDEFYCMSPLALKDALYEEKEKHHHEPKPGFFDMHGYHDDEKDDEGCRRLAGHGDCPEGCRRLAGHGDDKGCRRLAGHGDEEKKDDEEEHGDEEKKDDGDEEKKDHEEEHHGDHMRCAAEPFSHGDKADEGTRRLGAHLADEEPTGCCVEGQEPCTYMDSGLMPRPHTACFTEDMMKDFKVVLGDHHHSAGCPLMCHEEEMMCAPEAAKQEHFYMEEKKMMLMHYIVDLISMKLSPEYGIYQDPMTNKTFFFKGGSCRRLGAHGDSKDGGEPEPDCRRLRRLGAHGDETHNETKEEVDYVIHFTVELSDWPTNSELIGDHVEHVVNEHFTGDSYAVLELFPLPGPKDIGLSHHLLEPHTKPLEGRCVHHVEDCRCGPHGDERLLGAHGDAPAEPGLKACQMSHDIISCFPADKPCPLVCEEGFKACHVHGFDDKTLNATYEEFCIEDWQACPCPEGENTCMDKQGFEFCSPDPCDDVGCPNGYCNKVVYDEEGYPIDETTSCAGRDGKCKCHPKHEITCKFKGEHVCYSKAWMGGEDAKCPCEQKTCFVMKYDADGHIAMDANGNDLFSEVCVKDRESCPCDPVHESKCPSPDGKGFDCAPKLWRPTCPLVCGPEEQICYQFNYTADGDIDFDILPKESCSSAKEICPCNAEHENTCKDEMGMSYCLPKAFGECPVFCNVNQTLCGLMPYDENGNIDFTKPYKEVCAPVEEGCPCDADWEEKCGSGLDAYCTSKRFPCPLECVTSVCVHPEYAEDGTVQIDAWGYPKMKEQCAATMDGCGCVEGFEIQCDNEFGDKDCLPTSVFKECPQICTAEQFVCFEESFSSVGRLQLREKCMDDWYACYGLCGEGAKMCGTVGTDRYCIWDQYECPVVCPETQRKCYVDNFARWTGAYESTLEVCVDLDTPCPCGENTLDPPCSYIDELGATHMYCLPIQASEDVENKCPVSCDPATQQVCVDTSFTADGSIDFEKTSESCAAKGTTCACNGANSRQCTIEFVDEKLSWCQPAKIDGIDNPCPVICNSQQELCITANYNNFGKVIGFNEMCIAKGATCGCGLGSITCGEGVDAYCLPAVDEDTMEANKCPMICDQAANTHCLIPSFDAFGDVMGFVEECVAGVGAKCDCSKGMNGVHCPAYLGCVSKTTYCPEVCAEGTVMCDEVANYDAAGQILNFAPPPKGKGCAATYGECPCGSMARKCSYDDGSSWCQPKDMPCPLNCAAQGKKSCFVTNYNAEGGFLGEKEQCVDITEQCPCGAGAGRCPGTDMCLPAKEQKAVCPCKLTETACSVEDFSATGKLSGTSTVCVPTGNKCPCGKNTLTCEDKFQKGKTTCHPKSSKDGKAACPDPCGPMEELLEGKATCTILNRDKKGKFTSMQQECHLKGKCPLGTGMIMCPTNATIKAGSICKDPYRLMERASKGRRLEGRMLQTASGEIQTSTVVFSLKDVAGTKAAVAGASKTAQADIDNAMFVSSPLVSKMTVTKPSDEDTTATVVYILENMGTSLVTPSEVAMQLKTKIQTADTSITKAMAAIGKVDSGKGATVTTTSKVAEVRGQTVAPTPAPTPLPPTTTPATQAPTPAPNLTANNTTTTTVEEVSTTTVPSGPKTTFNVLLTLNSVDDFKQNNFLQSIADAAGVALVNVAIQEIKYTIRAVYEMPADLETDVIKAGLAAASGLDAADVSLTVTEPSAADDEERRLAAHAAGVSVAAVFTTANAAKAKTAMASTASATQVETAMKTAAGVETLTMSITTAPTLAVEVKTVITSSTNAAVTQPTAAAIVSSYKAVANVDVTAQVAAEGVSLTITTVAPLTNTTLEDDYTEEDGASRGVAASALLSTLMYVFALSRC